jgi:hypothetical protein
MVLRMDRPSPSAANRIDGDNLPALEELVDRNWVSLRQVASLLGVTYHTILRYIKPTVDDTGHEIAPARLKVVKIGGQYRVYEDELRRFLSQGNHR